MAKRAVFIVLPLALLFLAGCATVSRPGSIPEIKLENIGRFESPLSVDLINNQPDRAENKYAGIGLNSFCANYNEWTQFFIDKLGEELKKRGATVSQASQNKLKVSLSDFAYAPGFATVRAGIRFSLEMPERNWKKEWVASDVSGWSMGRAFGSVIYNAISQLLEDPEFIGLLQERE